MLMSPRPSRNCRRILLPPNQTASETKAGINHPAGIWFNEPTRELSFRAERYDLNYTLIHLDNIERSSWVPETHVEDTFERFARR
jgi:hypothetical protein